MIPRLVRFYGGDPIRWLSEMPLVIVKACHHMIAPLSAEESILMVNRIGTTFGGDAGRAALEGWRQIASMAVPIPAERTYHTPEQVQAMGLKVFRPKSKPVPA